MADRQCGEFFAAASKEHVADGHQPVCPQLVQRRKSRVEIAFGAGLQDMNLQAERAGCWLQTSQKGIRIEIGWVDEQSYDLGAWDRVMQQFQEFGFNLYAQVGRAGYMPPGWLRLATRPICTGSRFVVKTIGIVVVAAFAACAAGVERAAITVTCR